ncbi:homeodomain-interacting protein kinase 3-like isoform X2 [Dunckerocampus dactyliophorus]|uniref:homeodomain-interacting protein kinase 3-like isoform X2 n=1 Tax=Dunckerocampus dactyliophorus TaxID=161453 RepID=UPI0024049F51|nr:homeodomain-interacting protein kinase 3-like isoform X2 [Dunckerocampus dactyliophorus]XP_054636926.1 homeodomain-interacting protein kinase 3-like isoform X2 [Dunckerocampus dactyliophorus]
MKYNYMFTVLQNPDYRVPAKDLTSSEEKAVTQSCSPFEAYRYLNVLHSPKSDYEILDFLGEGTFGDVVKCLKTATREEVAVKIFKHIDAPDKFEKEVSTLQTLMAFDTDKVNLIQCKSIFVDRVYMCLEFEMMDINLWDFMNTRPTKCLLVKEIRPILHQLRKIEHILGHLPQGLLNIGLNTIYFYKKELGFRSFHWRLKTPNEYGYVACTDSFINSVDDLCEVRQVVHLSNEDTTAEVRDQESFVDLLKKLMRPDASQRLTPSQILQHPFITMADIVSHATSFYVKLSCEMMEVCQNQSISSDIQASKSLASDQEATTSKTPLWQSQREHPDILRISSRITGGLNLKDLSSDTQMAISHQLAAISLHKSPPHKKMCPVSGKPQKEDKDGIQRQRDVSSEMTDRMSKAESAGPNDNQSRNLQNRKAGKIIPNGDRTLNVEVEDSDMTTSTATADSSAQRNTNCGSNKRVGDKRKTPKGTSSVNLESSFCTKIITNYRICPVGPRHHKRKWRRPIFRPVFNSQSVLSINDL